MTTLEFRKILKEKTPGQVMSKYMRGDIFLTKSQLDRVIRLKKGTPEEGRGGVNTK